MYYLVELFSLEYISEEKYSDQFLLTLGHLSPVMCAMWQSLSIGYVGRVSSWESRRVTCTEVAATRHGETRAPT